MIIIKKKNNNKNTAIIISLFFRSQLWSVTCTSMSKQIESNKVLHVQVWVNKLSLIKCYMYKYE